MVLLSANFSIEANDFFILKTYTDLWGRGLPSQI